MHLLYLDESGHSHDPSSAFFVLAGFSIFERQTHWLENQLDRIGARVDPARPHAAEFHGSVMYGGRDEWKGVAPATRAQAVVDILSLLSDRQLNLKVFASVIEKSLMAPDAILRQSFENVAAAFDRYLYSLYRKKDPQRGLVIFDKSSYEQQLQDLSQVFKRDGHQKGKLYNFAEVPLFLDSKASRLIQMADIIAYWIFRYFQSGDNRGYNLIAPRFCHHSGAFQGLVANVSTETGARLQQLEPHKYPFPAPTPIAAAKKVPEPTVTVSGVTVTKIDAFYAPNPRA
ncbi:DUF3800 domain-containing protein [Trinickia symbiotica]|uniref:DUF3800 domain-containing protein n=1 Tax=Trinickia symbiotica TaxID=863227 RepID=A0A2T3Y0U2_9BURK|nr:DUF3800 domain-containing protein [Trinickia symbiotica]PTB22394.1 DUF3800 domain-containing protein [Trinickia symbiotica]